MRFKTWRLAFVLGAAAAALGGWGCSQDILNNDTASIVGRVQNRAGGAIAGIRVGVIYQASLLGPVPRAARAAGATLGNAYPNPLSDTGGGVIIPLTGVSDTTVAVEIRAELGGVAGVLRHLFTGPVTRDTTFTWDGLDDTNVLVPNGRYTIRLTVPANPPSGTTPSVQEKIFVVNRSQAIVEFYQAYNAQTDFDGQFIVQDLGVGAHFTATNASGNVLGDAFLANQVIVMFRDPDHVYLPDQTSVVVGPKETVDVSYILDSNAPSPLPPPETR